MNKFKIIPFNLTDYKTEGNKVLTRDLVHSVKILDTNRKSDFNVVALLDEKRIECYDSNGKYSGNDLCYHLDLVIAVPTRQRKMTNKELSRWLQNKPLGEIREFRLSSGYINSSYFYKDIEENNEIDPAIRIRINDGDWLTPMIEE